jgi:hypothetical protein
MSSDELRYTLFKPVHDLDRDDEVIGRGLTLAEASKAIRECDGQLPYFHHRDYGAFRAAELCKRDAKGKLKLVIGATVPATKDVVLDREKAERMIDVQIIARCHQFCKYQALTDTEFDQRITRVTNRRAVRALERQITTELVDRLIADGYRITCCVRFDNPPFRNSRRRDAILKLLFDLELADLHVHKGGETFWISLIFGEDGWDTIADHSTDLSYLIDPIVEPHLPWNKPGSKDRGYTILTLPSPEELESGNPEAREAADQFFGLMEKIV